MKPENNSYADCCGACRFFSNEDVFGWGICDLHEEIMMCDENCPQGESKENKPASKNKKT